MLQEKEGYDQAVTMYSPEGRLYQVEYARMASKRGGIVVAMQVKGGVILVASKGHKSKLLRSDKVEKIHRIYDNIFASTSGLLADAKIIIDYARESTVWYEFNYGEKPDLSSLMPEVQELLWMYTEYGAVRPFGVSTIFVGPKHGKQTISVLDVTGTKFSASATAIGMNSKSAREVLEKKHRANMTQEEGLDLVLSILKTDMEDLSEYEIEAIYITDSGFEHLKVTA